LGQLRGPFWETGTPLTAPIRSLLSRRAGCKSVTHGPDVCDEKVGGQCQIAEVKTPARILLGFLPEKAAALKLKADLHTKIVKVASRYSQRELQNILQTSQPRVSDLLRFYAERLGLETSIKTHARTRGASAGIANFAL
jgi:predicted XRE-type DNA-binding protein